MLLFLSIVLIMLLFISLIVLSEIRLNIENFEYANYNVVTNPNQIRLELYFLGKIKWFSFKLNNKRFKKKFNKNHIKQKMLEIKQKERLLTKDEKKRRNKIAKNIAKKLLKKVQIRQFKLEMLLDTKSVETTSYLIGLISFIIPNIIRYNIKEFEKDKYSLKILPIYQDKNNIYIKLNCIFSIKIVHIINMFKLVNF